ncbi:MAG: hypothetical protein AB1411_08205 [Nitrospirota bacterium]
MEPAPFDEIIEKHHVSGLDERQRGFNRTAEINGSGEACRATFRYETTRIVTDWLPTRADALNELIRTLQARGYSQLRSRLSFQGPRYVGGQDFWIDYPDPDRPPEPIGKSVAGSAGWLRHLSRIFRR